MSCVRAPSRDRGSALRLVDGFVSPAAAISTSSDAGALVAPVAGADAAGRGAVTCAAGATLDGGTVIPVMTDAPADAAG